VRYFVVALLTLAGTVTAQGPAPEFEVASIKPSPPDPPRAESLGSLRLPPGRWRGVRLTLTQYIGVAYPEFAFEGRVLGGPAWIREAIFDIDARMAPKTTPAQMAPMMARLLADRFALHTHTEQRSTNVYLLKMARPDARLGPGLKRSAEACVEAKKMKQPIPAEAEEFRGPE
jgi:uncharacterized protein (TIGR03435 family)